MGVSCSTCEDANSEAAHEASKNIANQSLDQNPYVVRSIESNSRNWNNHQEIPQLISQQEQYNQTSSQRPNSNLVELPLGSTQPEIKSIQPVQLMSISDGAPGPIPNRPKYREESRYPGGRIVNPYMDPTAS